MKTLSAAAALPMLAGTDIVIVDPPRKGLDYQVLDALCQTKGPSQILYLSCGPVSFQRDCEKLFAHGWKVDNAEAYLFFPGSNHVEILCSLKRSG